MKRSKFPSLMDAGPCFVVARDPSKKMVLLGGLGAMGVGEMWFKDEPPHRDYHGYDDAPIQDSTGGFGT